MLRFHQLCNSVSVFHVAVLVAVIAHHADGVLPDSRLLVIDVVVDFVDNNLRIFSCTCRNASYGKITFLCQQTGTFIVV